MVEIFVQPLVGALCLIVFHIQAVMDSPDHFAWQLGLQVVSSQNSSQQKVLRSPRYAHLHATFISKLELGVVACGGPGVGHRPNVYTAMCVPNRARSTADQAKKHRYRRTGHSISNKKASTSYTNIEGAFIDIVSRYRR